MTPHSPGSGASCAVRLSSTKRIVAEDMLPKRRARMRERVPRRLVQVEQHAGAIEHASSRGVQHPVPRCPSRLSPCALHQRRRHLAHHHRADAPHVLGEHHARPPARVLEAHRVEVLGAEHGAMLHDRRPAAVATQGERARAVGEDGVGHRALQPVVEEVGRRADLDGEHQRAVTGKRADVVRTPAAARPPRRRSRCRRRARAACRGGSRAAPTMWASTLGVIRPVHVVVARKSTSCGLPARTIEGPARAASPSSSAPSPEAIAQLVDRLVGTEASPDRSTGIGRRCRWLRKSRDGARPGSRPSPAARPA